NGWQFTDSKPQGKDDIADAFSALYAAPNGDQVLFAGLDRFDTSGDASAGFWFFQHAVSESPNVSGNATGPLVGRHHVVDMPVVADFTVGGSVGTITVCRWTGDDATGSLVQLSAPLNSTFGILNSTAITVPWSFTDKSHNSGPAPREFLEVGVNLSALGLNACFASFLAETRSSQAPNSTLSDFVIGSFNTCKLELPNTATVKADGIDPITSNQVVITVLDNPLPH